MKSFANGNSYPMRVICDVIRFLLYCSEMLRFSVNVAYIDYFAERR